MTMPQPTGVLLCRPTYFDLLDVKNPFMEGAPPVNRALALQQWLAMRTTFETAGLEVFEIEPVPGLEDMVFTANPAFTGLNRAGERIAVPSCMKFPSRAAEVSPTRERLVQLGYRIQDVVPPEIGFEGGGDAVWHPGQRIIYGGYGWRSSLKAYPYIERAFEAAVVPLELVDERFYHLDTALCALDEDTALIVPQAFSPAGIIELNRAFKRLIELNSNEALTMAANATAGPRKHIIIDEAATQTIARLRALHYTILSVDTSEFRKSGGSVYCMKQYLF
ncbi:MAG: arginine deiminase-related protein [Candidatus Eremiobacteraeota bacterium]|nr:arginine deiminase-related protein [Candidatus Eremiobacteraeota bacterium]